MLRHAYHVSATRNFRLNPKEVSGLSSLDPNQPICIPASMCPRTHRPLARRAQRDSQAAVDPPTRSADPYSLVSRETSEDHSRPQLRERERESDKRPGCPSLRCAPSRPPSCSLRSPSCAAGATRTGRVMPRSCSGDRYSLVSRETIEHRPRLRSRTRPTGRGLSRPPRTSASPNKPECVLPHPRSRLPALDSPSRGEYIYTRQKEPPTEGPRP